MSYFKEMKEYYKLSSKDLSADSLRTLRATAMIGLLAVIMALLMIWSIVPPNPFTGLMLALGLILGALALFHRLPNSLSLSLNHLDEWGENAKKDAEAFTYRVVFRASLVMTFIGFVILSSDSIPGLHLVLTPSFERLAGTLILITVLLQMITTNRLAWSTQPLSKGDVIDMYEIEKPRKQGKWTVIITMSILFGGLVGGKFLDYRYGDVVVVSPKNCVTSITSEAPLAQVKPLYYCAKDKSVNED